MTIDTSPEALERLADMEIRLPISMSNETTLAILAMRSTLRAIAAEKRAQQWQPIETAPRNGIWFLAVDSTGRRRMVRWADKFDRLPINDEEGMWNTQPTHWMPLPKPPEGV